MENPFEKKPAMLAISLGAIILLILGAGIISSYFGKPAEPATLPDSSYSVTWEDLHGNLIPQEGISREIKAKFSLLNVQQMSIPVSETTTASRALTLTIDALILDPSSSTSKTCAWKLPISIRRVSDEVGTLVPPKEAYFESTPNAEHCVTPGLPAIAEKNIIFQIPETEREFLFTVAGPLNILFTVELGADGAIKVDRVPQEIPG